MLLASVGAHVLVDAVSPRGEPHTGSGEEQADLRPVELLDTVPVSMVAEPEPEPEPERIPEPELEPLPEPDASPPAPEPPPPSPPPKPRPPKATPAKPVAAPAESSGSVPVADAETATPAEPPPPAEPRALDLTLSNDGGGEGGSGRGRGRRPARSAKAASSGCTEPRSKPRPLTKKPVKYTREARAAGLEGRLILRAAVDRRGTVTAVEVVQSVGSLVDDAGVAAMRQWTFEPASACGKPVASQYTIARDFTLGD